MAALKPLPWQQPTWQQLLGWSRAQLPHALLIHGARGIGKRMLAEAFAQTLLCETPTADGACGVCASCQLLAVDNHPDLQRLVPALDLQREADDGDTPPAKAGTKPSREIVIDQVRDIGEFLAVSAHRGGRRAVLLMPAESLNPSAANALLKTLEEPPPGAHFVAVSDRLDAVLPTIVSRCVLLRAPMPTAQQALAWLKAQGVGDAEARLAEAGGAPLGLEVEDDPRALSPEQRAALMTLLLRGRALQPAEIAAGLGRDHPVSASIRLLQRWGGDLLSERLTQRVRYYPGERRALVAIAQGAQPARLLQWLDELNDAQRASEHPLNARLVIERLLLRYRTAISIEH